MTKKLSLIKLFSVTSLFVFISCATMPGMPGFISESSSDFDGTKQLSMEPAWLPYSPIKLALFKNTKMDKNEVVLSVIVKEAHIFGRDESLHINIDGDIVSFMSIDPLTDRKVSSGHYGNGFYIPPFNWSSKDYLITKNLIKRLIEADRAVVKVDLRKSYAEGIFSHDAPTLARPAFREFYKKMDNL